MIWSTLSSPKRARHARPRARAARPDPTSPNGLPGAPPSDGAAPSAEHGRLARSSGLSFFGMVSSVALGFAFVLVVTHLEHVQGAGTLFEAIAAFTILENVAELGADTGLLRILPRYRVARATQDLRSLFLVSLLPPVVAATVAAGVLYGLAPQFAHVFIHNGSVKVGVSMIRTVAPFLPFATLMTVAVAASRGLEAFGPYVGIQSFGVPFLRPVLLGAFVAAGLSGPRGLALAWGGPLAIGCIAALVLLYRRARSEFLADRPLHPALHVRQVASEFWRFASPRGLAAVFQIMVIWVDILLVGAIESPRQAAIYTVASRYVLMGTVALQALGIALAPQISRLLASGRREEARSVFRLATWWVIVASWPLFFFLACFSPLLMQLFGHTYGSGAHALTILALGMLVLTGTGSNGVVLLMAGKSSWSLAINAVSLAINLALNLLLIPHIGIEGAAIAWAATIAFNNGTTAVLVWRHVHLDSLGWGAVVAVGISGIAGGVALAARLALGAGVLSFLVALGVGGSLTAVAVWRGRSVLRLDAFRGLLVSPRLDMTRPRGLAIVVIGVGALVGGCASTPTTSPPTTAGHHHLHHHHGKGSKHPKNNPGGVTPTTSGSVNVSPATPVAAPAAPSLSCSMTVPIGANLTTVVAGAWANTVFCLSSGAYILTATVTPKSGDAFVGNAVNRPVIDASAVFDGFSDVNASGVTFENLEIEGARLNGSKTQCTYCGRGIWGGNVLKVFNVEFIGNQQAGIAGSEGTTTPWLIVDSQFIGNGDASEVGFSSGGIKGSNAYTILNSYVADNVGSGIWCDVGCRGGTWTVEGNTVIANTAGGIRYEISDAGALISGNVVAENNISAKEGLAGIEIASSGNAVVEHNLLIDNINAAILVGGNGRRGSEVTNDLIEDNNTQGQGVQGCDRAGVTCQGNS